MTNAYNKLIILNNNGGIPFLQLDLNSSQEEVSFQRSDVYSYIVEIYPKSHENNGSKKFLYSEIGQRVLLTAFLDYDFNGIINPKRPSRNIEMENVSQLGRLERRHLERTNDKLLYNKEDIVEHAQYAYSMLINASRPIFSNSNI